MSDAAHLRLTRIPKTVLSEEVLQALREAIVFRVYRPGERLVEREVGHRLGVSQGPVREAFRKLEAEGLVTTHPHQGTYVVSLEEEDIRQIEELRLTLERVAVQTLARDAGSVDLSLLHTLAQALTDAARRSDDRSYVDYDCLFHRTLCQLTHNERLEKVWTLLSGQIRMVVAMREALAPAARQAAAEQHAALVVAIEARDLQQAEELLPACLA